MFDSWNICVLIVKIRKRSQTLLQRRSREIIVLGLTSNCYIEIRCLIDDGVSTLLEKACFCFICIEFTVSCRAHFVVEIQNKIYFKVSECTQLIEIFFAKTMSAFHIQAKQHIIVSFLQNQKQLKNATLFVRSKNVKIVKMVEGNYSKTTKRIIKNQIKENTLKVYPKTVMNTVVKKTFKVQSITLKELHSSNVQNVPSRIYLIPYLYRDSYSSRLTTQTFTTRRSISTCILLY